MVLLSLVFFFSCTAWNSLNGSLKMKNPLRTPIEAPGSHPKPILRVWIINLAAAERNSFDEKVFRWPLLLLLDLSTVSVLWVKLFCQRERRERETRKNKKTLMSDEKNTKEFWWDFLSFVCSFHSFSLFFSLFLSFSLRHRQKESFLAQRISHIWLCLSSSVALRGTLSILLIFLTTKNFFARTLSHSHSHSHYV